MFSVYFPLDLKGTCPTLKMQCVETGGNCMLDENEIILCVCPGGTEYMHDVGCKGGA